MPGTAAAGLTAAFKRLASALVALSAESCLSLVLILISAVCSAAGDPLLAALCSCTGVGVMPAVSGVTGSAAAAVAATSERLALDVTSPSAEIWLSVATASGMVAPALAALSDEFCLSTAMAASAAAALSESSLAAGIWLAAAGKAAVLVHVAASGAGIAVGDVPNACHGCASRADTLSVSGETSVEASSAEMGIDCRGVAVTPAIQPSDLQSQTRPNIINYLSMGKIHLFKM